MKYGRFSITGGGLFGRCFYRGAYCIADGSETAELEQEMESELLNLRFGNQDEGTAEDKEAEG